ncbi:MAG: hypothetical protein HY054_09305 [Proteobacteria bacterium]|nr:hypothetical protein [Pseudomonadota bacterium]
MTRRSSLTGSWSGAFRYPADRMPETVFNAQIEEIGGGGFTGDIQEDDWRYGAPDTVITSQLDGKRTGNTITFVKFYDGSGDQVHAVRYEGTANDTLTRIEGRWIINENWSGTFFMTLRG